MEWIFGQLPAVSRPFFLRKILDNPTGLSRPCYVRALKNDDEDNDDDDDDYDDSFAP